MVMVVVVVGRCLSGDAGCHSLVGMEHPTPNVGFNTELSTVINGNLE